MRIRALSIGLALATTVAPTASSQTPEAPRPDRARTAALKLRPPPVELGEMFKDDEFGFEFRLPKGMSILPPADLAKLRESSIAPKHERTNAEGTVGKIQVWQWFAPDGSNIFLRMHSPPVDVDSPNRLRRVVSEEDRLLGRPVEDVEKLYEFSDRGGRTGFLVTREFGVQPGRPTSFKQHTAYLRGPTRSYLVQFSAPKDRFNELEDDFKAAICTFAIHQTKDDMELTKERTKDGEGLASFRVLGNVAILAILLVLGFVAMLNKGAFFRATAGESSSTKT